MANLVRGEYDPKMPTYRYKTEQEIIEANEKMEKLKAEIIRQFRALNPDLTNV